MIVKVHEHTIEIVKTPVNELEVNVTKMQFVFDETIPTNYIKKAFFTNGDVSKVIELVNDECNIPVEVLHKKGQVRLGVIAYEVQDETLIERFNPRPAYFTIWEGSLIEADNTEPITPTDKEQIEQMLSNINIDGNKSGKITTITITYKDGTTKELQLEDGKSIEYNWQGTQLGIRQEGQSEYVYVDLKGEKGDAGAIKMLIVAELPSTGANDTIYLVPIPKIEVASLPATGEPKTIYIVTGTGKRYIYESEQWLEVTNDNNYFEYVYINNKWEELGEIGVQVDLTDYVKNTDYATTLKGGVVKGNDYYNANISPNSGTIYCTTNTYTQYQNKEDNSFISKGTLENVITGKGLINNQVNNLANYYTKTEIDDTIGDISSALDTINGEVI